MNNIAFFPWLVSSIIVFLYPVAASNGTFSPFLIWSDCRTWIGLRFLRALRLMTFPDILQYLNILKTSTSIRYLELKFSYNAIWISYQILDIDQTMKPIACKFYQCLEFILFIHCSSGKWTNVLTNTAIGVTNMNENLLPSLKTSSFKNWFKTFRSLTKSISLCLMKSILYLNVIWS